MTKKSRTRRAMNRVFNKLPVTERPKNVISLDEYKAKWKV